MGGSGEGGYWAWDDCRTAINDNNAGSGYEWELLGLLKAGPNRSRGEGEGGETCRPTLMVTAEDMLGVYVKW